VLGLFITLLIIDNYFKTQRNYLKDRRSVRATQKDKADSVEGVGDFEVLDSSGLGSIQSVTTIRDKQTVYSIYL